jgi:LacI family transcriptional regulator
MPESRVTIIDVARAASVHPSTVSRVLNGRAELSVLPETRARVVAAAKRLGYRPSQLARGLRLHRTFTLGMLISNITNPLFPPIIKAVDDTGHARGYNLVLCNTEDKSEREATYLQVLSDSHVDGLLIASSFTADATLAGLRRDRFPFVLVNRGTRRGEDLCVQPDNARGMAQAVGHLVELGHRRIGVVAGPQTTTTGVERLDGARAALRSHRLRLEDELVSVSEGFSDDAGYRAARRLLRTSEPPTAVLCANDLIALGTLRAARELDLDVPAELSIVGFGDIPRADLLGPPLTTVHVPQHEMGVRAATMLIALIEGEPIERRREVLETQLVVRGSTAAPAQVATKTA